MVLKAVVKALKKADRLKERMQISKDLLTDNEAWLSQQQLQRVYQQVLILDLEYALDKKVEQDLWNHGFKNFIANLQNSAKDKKNPKHSESQAMLYWCLEAASGFYLSLLHEICSAFDLDLPFRRKGSIYGCNRNISSISNHCQPNKSSCYYICQHCLVHLGDIARYRNQSRQAEAFYRYAVQLAPSSGQPYNQLAILEASRGDKLSTVYHYVRSVALRHPFPVAATNLSRTLEKHAEEVVKLEGHNKLSSYEYITTFLKLHGLMHTHTELETAEKLVQILTTSLTAHIATESLSSWKLVQIVTINIFALHQAGGSIDGKIRSFSEEQLTRDEQKIKLLICDLLAASLSAFLLPVYTIKPGEPLLDYFAMPAVKLTLEWVRQEPSILQKSSFKTRLQIWPSLCKLLNDVQPTIADFAAENYTHVPLPEDRDLQGFLPFEKCFQNLKFHTEDLKLDVKTLNKLRVARLVEFGVWLSEQTGLNIITCKKVSESDKTTYVFEATGRQEPPSGEQIREFEEMILTKLPSPTPSEASGSITGASTPDSSGFFSSLLVNPLLKFKATEFSSQENLQEKRPGILKSQIGSEKSSEKNKNEKVVKMVPSNRGQRNVALQTIINKNSEEIKQVTFKTPSPVKDSTQENRGKDVNSSPKKQNSPKSADQKSADGQGKKGEDVGKEKKSVKQWNNAKGKSKDASDDADKSDCATQQKLIDSLNAHGKKGHKNDSAEGAKEGKRKEKTKEVPFSELMSAFPPLPGVKDEFKNSTVWSTDGLKETEKEGSKIFDVKISQKNVSKQQLLSELFSKNKPLDLEQNSTQNMSGLLNLSKQQQQMLTDSKTLKSNHVLQQQQQPPPQQQQQTQTRAGVAKADLPQLLGNIALQKLKCNDKMEAARREYEAACFTLQQKQEQDAHKHFHESDINQFEYDRRLNLQHQQPPQVQQQNQPPVYVRVNQPVINFGAFGYKYSQFYLPWQEPQEPPMPPSWWSETPQIPQQQQHQISDSFGAVPPPQSDSIYTPGHQGNNGVPSLSVGGSSYSLFSNSSWNTVSGGGENESGQNYNLSGGIMGQQSFWSGPGPSPLERLLEQQKQMREATPLESKNGT
ncbi:UNVERIFIED_CONTAM: hypothetical protein PYX00_003648 [Menopon gallinae]|uniref:Protein SMG7 n=1 Tax=Menopon gallinae TaxID=328185 RepID=A0AAW2I0R7_9NEOP